MPRHHMLLTHMQFIALDYLGSFLITVNHVRNKILY